MTFTSVCGRLCGIAAVVATLAAGPATRPAGLEGPADELILPPGTVTAAAGSRDVIAEARLDGRLTQVRFGLDVPTGRGPQGCPLVVSLAGRLSTAAARIPSVACLTPQCPAGHTWAEPATQVVLRQLVDGVVAAAGLDADHVVLTGADAWPVATGLADRWAAVAPVGGPPPADADAAVDALWHVGVELTVSPAERPTLAAFAARPHPTFTFRTAATDPAAAYADPAFWGWLLAQHRSADTSPPPGRRDPNVHLGPPTVVPTTVPPVSVDVDTHALPTAAGFSIVPATLRLDGKSMPFDFGLYLPPGWPHAAGYHGGPVPTLVNLHWREFFGGDDRQVIQETLAKLLVRTPTESRHRGERPADPVPLTNVAPVICIMPHCPAGCRFERQPGMAEAVGLLIDRVVPALHADADRVFLTGVSYGGSSAWLVGQRIAPRLAGIVPCDGRRTADPAATVAALADVGAYVSVGSVDGDFTNDARVMVAALAAAGHTDTVYHEVHGGNHFCFSSTYTDPAFWAWLTTTRRRPHATPSPPLVAAPTVPAGSILLASIDLAPAAPPATPAPRPDAPKAEPPKPTPVAAAPVVTPVPKPDAPKVEPPKAAPAAPVAAPAPKPEATKAVAPPAVPVAPPAPKPEPPKVDPPKAAAPAAELPKPAPPAPPPPVPAPAPPALPPNQLDLVGVAWPTSPGYHVFKVTARLDGKAARFRFGVFLPSTFAAAGTGRWPVVMSLHNKGPIGGDGNGSITGEGLPYLLTHDDPDGRLSGEMPANAIDLKNHAPFVLVAPQCPTGHTWDDPAMIAAVDQVLEAVVANCHGDPERTYLTGFSFGASNTWAVAAALPGHFAAIAPIDGRATSDPDATVKQLARTGVFQVIGGVDGGFWPEAKRMVAALAAGPHPDFAFHVVPGGNHFCYGCVYTDPTFWQWMFARRRAVRPKPAVVAAPVVKGVSVTVDPAALPRRPGYAVVRPTVTVDGVPLSVPVGVWLPTSFPRAAAPLPVIVSLHNRYAIGLADLDAALCGEGLPMILTHGNPNRGEHGPVPEHPVNPATDVQFIGLFPQCPAGQKFESDPMPEVVDKAIGAVLAGYGTSVADPDRVYATGWSYGGSCTWAAATANPNRYAAVAVNDGRAAADPPATVAKLHDVAIYLAVGENDGEFVDNERRMLDALDNGHHPNFAQRVVAHADHAAYMAVYSDPAFWGWLLAQRRHHS